MEFKNWLIRVLVGLVIIFASANSFLRQLRPTDYKQRRLQLISDGFDASDAVIKVSDQQVAVIDEVDYVVIGR